jgi:methylase of polypeptide subunit release factors
MAADPDELGRAYEASLPAARRRRDGVHYTPADVADGLVAIALDGVAGTPLVCDPACGGGAFLLAAGRALAARGLDPRRIAAELLWGMDSDSGAVRVTRDAIAAWAGVDPGDHVVVGDGLRASERWPGRFDVVVGNPPFQNQLERATLRSVPLRPTLAAVAGAYTDTSWLFLVDALDLVHANGRIVLVQPQSLLAARDARAVRDEVSRRAALHGVWTCADPVFDADVRVCAPVLHAATSAPSRVRRWQGRTFIEDSPRALAQGSNSWAALRSGGDPPPAFRVDAAAPTLGSIATATAGFRRQFYGVAPFVVDRADADDATHPKLVTVGLIDPGAIAWGTRATRLAGQRFTHPRVDLAALRAGATPDVARWFTDRMHPKVLVATQTKVVEAAVDRDGTWLPSTPVIAVHAAPEDLWRIGAALLAPPVTAWALDHYGGTALAHDAVKLAASQVLEVPLPSDEGAWDEAARLLADGAAIIDVGTAMNRAYGGSGDLLAWWSQRV